MIIRSLWTFSLIFMANTALALADDLPVLTFAPPSGPHNFHEFGMGGGNLGFRFTAASDFTVSALGYYDYNGTSLTGDHPVVLEDESGKAIPNASATIHATSKLASDNFRYEKITPVKLPAGTYIISGFAGTDTGGDGAFARNVSSLVLAPGFTLVGGVFNSTTTNSPYQGTGFEAANNYFGPNFKILSDARTASTAVPASGQKIKVACVGDSITYGFQITGPTPTQLSEPYPATLQNLLGDGYEVKNFGAIGKTVCRSTSAPYDTAQALAYQPDWVIIMLGTNDAKSVNWPAQKSNFDTDYAALIKSFQDLPSKPKIWVVIPAPVYKSNYDIQADALNNEVAPEVAKIAQVAGVPAINVNLALRNKADLFADGIHPNQAGATIIAHTVYDEVSRAGN